MIKVVYAVGLMISLFIPTSCTRNTQCDLLTYTYLFPEHILDEFDYMKIYLHEEDFTIGENGVLGENNNGFVSFELTGDNQDLPFIDIRRTDGTNSWSNQAEIVKLGQSAVNYASCLTEINYSDQEALNKVVNSSPTYMHLVLNDAEQDGGSKTWEIGEVYDENRNNVSDRPEWICIRNLLFTFFKGGKGAVIKIAIKEGDTPCGVFKELFGERMEAFATYSLEGGAQDELRITAPAVSDALKAQLTFNVMSTGYDEIEINLTNGDNQLGYALLTPVSDEE
ncbi:hypothetical protein H8S90_12705 [Olivibacter sp. SDN3]|uniref:hypothetical protein n=1 Tax=Olivibacter sp. SDN3 TaxID=2764720 RepID=UPI00165109D4|nr:hypothetical protein [Olivibacter sp. SDN3]QNL47691.1 hypothetical protein H8S90_12705 [Olivibacter sp. SDN3]